MPSTNQPVHGNFHGYYAKRPFLSDPRLAALPQSLFEGARVLDVGCNEGWVTCEIAQSKGARRVVGVDIDDTLIRAAWKRRRYVWSLQEPAHDDAAEREEPGSSVPKKRKLDGEAGREEAHQLQANYFPASCQHMFGPLPIPPQRRESDVEHHLFPHNITFCTADWVNKEILEDREGYDIVLALSVTKWIHLNGGDEGLMRFFRRVYSVLKPGGTFVLEPQEWHNYAKTKRMDPKLKENAKSLKLRPDDFERVLQDVGLSPAEHLGKIGEGGFRRAVDVYTKPA
ncbi:Bin3-domain-containing protein [Laetiporus sulphureus 93-53]|uniref:RNA methyltransferase n=1 Tax=Laetiporus sulphureus 93-53 TaxID=1314785 RepID=A0A165IG21_9APHY|nr:Bin3-domain-containing protein [Laetiporus sulphureus 93-53]KZT13021.1 Bin3-domain-containing protein [Laetiporus sulphureus 93-53]